MDPNRLKCMCGETYNVSDFQNHFGKCQQFKAEFKDFDSKFGELLKAYSEPKEKLLIVRFLLKLYIAVIEKKLKKYYDNLNKSSQAPNPNMINPPAPAPVPAQVGAPQFNPNLNQNPMQNPPIQQQNNINMGSNMQQNNQNNGPQGYPDFNKQNNNPPSFNNYQQQYASQMQKMGQNPNPVQNLQSQQNQLQNPFRKNEEQNNNNNNNMPKQNSEMDGYN